MIRTIANKIRADLTGTDIQPRRTATVVINGESITLRTRLVNPSESWVWLNARKQGHGPGWTGERAGNKPTDEIAVQTVLEKVVPADSITDEHVSTVVEQLT